MKKKILKIFCWTDATLAGLLLLRAGLAAFWLIQAYQSRPSVGIIGGSGFPSLLLLWTFLGRWLLPAILLILLLTPALIWLILLKKAEKRKE